MRTPAIKFLFICAVIGTALSAVYAQAREVPLLAPSQGQLPTDVGSDDMSKLSLTDKAELGGKVLQVERLGGDSFGDRVAKVTDWKEFKTLKFDAINSGDRNLRLTLTVKHRQTKNFSTRVDVPFTLKPGKNSVALPIGGMSNVNGSAPDLEHVVRWYIAGGGQPSALFFGDFVLSGPDASNKAVATAAQGLLGGSAVAYQITGKIGDMDVDLIAKPILNYSSGLSVKPIKTDSEKLARIRAAKMPAITKPIMFDTPEADAIVSALEIYPPDNPFNQIVEDWPVHPNSKAMIETIGADKPLRYNPDMGYILVPENQPMIKVKLTTYANESDPGPFPVPVNLPIEGWPAAYAQSHRGPKMTLEDVQRDKFNKGGDRHAIVVDPTRRVLYEFGNMKKTKAGWEAKVSSIFDLKSNKLRPLGWTSTDAAGLPLFPAVIRYDELARGMVEHAMRVTVSKSRRAFVAPATHYASRSDNEDYPRMGERLRLKKDFDISTFSPPVQAILKGLKRYGMFVADNGIDWAISVTPDPRIPKLHDELRKVPGSAFEVVVSPY